MRHVTFTTKAPPSLGAENVSPVARHVALMRQEWRDRLSEYEHAEHIDISGWTEAEQDAAFDRAGEALDALASTRAPDLATLADKMRLMHKTGTVLATGYFEDLLDDVDALAKRAVLVPTAADIRASIGALIKRGLAKIDPWYHCGRCERIRMDSQCRHFTDESWGEVHRFEIQWLGVHFAIELGRTPPKLTEAQVASRRAHHAHMTKGA